MFNFTLVWNFRISFFFLIYHLFIILTQSKALFNFSSIVLALYKFFILLLLYPGQQFSIFVEAHSREKILAVWGEYINM